jgi:regulatory protein
MSGCIYACFVRAPRKLGTEEQLYMSAMRALMRRAHSVYEMRQLLERRAEDETMVRAVLDRLKRDNRLDDKKFAREFARTRAAHRKQGRFRIARELRARGVPDRHIEAALDEAFAETNEDEMLAKRLERKLKFVRGPLNERKRASLYASLLRSGFSSDQIRKAMRGATGGMDEIPEAVIPEDE